MRVTRCFSFLDLSGFTRYTETHGDDQAVAVLAQLRAVLRAEAEHAGVRVTKWLGDGAMLSGVDAESVASCTLAVVGALDERSPLPLRAGLCDGAVIMFEGDDYIGAAVNVASRLCDAASAGQVLVASSLAGRLPRLETTPLGPIEVAGLSAPVEVCEVVASSDRAGAARPS